MSTNSSPFLHFFGQFHFNQFGSRHIPNAHQLLITLTNEYVALRQYRKKDASIHLMIIEKSKYISNSNE